MKIGQYLIAPLILSICVMVAATFIIYQLITLTPGYSTRNTDPLSDYGEWMFGGRSTEGVLNGDFGVSLTNREAALDIVQERLPASLELFTETIFQSLLYGIPFGLLMAAFRYRLTDGFIRPFAWLGVSLPVFWVALMLVLTYAIQQGDYPVAGRCSLAGEGCPPLEERLEYLTLPLFTLLIAWTPVVALYVRNSVLRILIKREGFRVGDVVINGLLRPILSSLPTMMAGVFSTLVLVETIFAWPGVGRLLVDSVARRDFPVMVAAITLPTLGIIGAFIVLNVLSGLVAILFGDSETKAPAKTTPSTFVPDPPAPVYTFSDPTTVRKGSNRRFIDSLYTLFAFAAFIVLVGITTAAFMPSVITETDPLEIGLTARLLAPDSDEHPLGTDELGRDQMARLLYGGQNTLLVAAQTAAVALLIGGLIGLVGGLSMNGIGILVNFPINIVMVALSLLPALPLLLLIIGVTDLEPEGFPFIMALIGWGNFVPAVRAQVAAMVNPKEKTPGAGSWLFLLIYGFAANMAFFILTEASLSFLGFGIQPPNASWGLMLAGARNYIVQADYLVIWPGILLTVTMFCLYVVANRIRDHFQFQ